MNINNVLTIAGSGIGSLSQQLAVVSQNIANANTPGYVVETATVSSVVAGGTGIGVRVGVASRNVDLHLQADAFAASASAAGQQVTSDALNAIDSTSGTPGSGTDLPSLLGAVTDAFSSLATDPSNATQQRAVVQRAGDLTQGLNRFAKTVADARQSAQDQAVADVATVNGALQTIGNLSIQITAGGARGESTAGLQDQRDAGIQTVVALTGAKFLNRPDGSVLGVLGGLVLPLDAKTGPFSLAPATLGPTAPPASSPSLLLSGQDVTSQVTGGRLGAELSLRDKTFPGLQSGLDHFAQTLATGFAGQGLTLFTDAGGNVPSLPGAALTLRVSALAQATPSFVRDGPTPGGLAGDATLINNVLNGPLGTSVGGVTDQAVNLSSGVSSLAADATFTLQTQKAISTALTAKLSTNEGVSVDSELANLVQLQNSYAANAKVLGSTDRLWTDLLAAVGR